MTAACCTAARKPSSTLTTLLVALSLCLTPPSTPSHPPNPYQNPFRGWGAIVYPEPPITHSYWRRLFFSVVFLGLCPVLQHLALQATLSAAVYLYTPVGCNTHSALQTLQVNLLLRSALAQLLLVVNAEHAETDHCSIRVFNNV